MSATAKKPEKKTNAQLDLFKSPQSVKKSAQVKGDQSKFSLQRSSTLNEVQIKEKQLNKSDRKITEQDLSNQPKQRTLQRGRSIKMLNIKKPSDLFQKDNSFEVSSSDNSFSQNELRVNTKKQQILDQRKHLFQIVETNINEECQSGLIQNYKTNLNLKIETVQSAQIKKSFFEFGQVNNQPSEPPTSDLLQTPKIPLKQPLFSSKFSNFIKQSTKAMKQKLENQNQQDMNNQSGDAQKSGFLQQMVKQIQEDSRGNTKVVIRFRPENELEKQIEKQENCKLEFPFQNSVILYDEGIPYQFTLDKVFPMETKQADIFEFVGVQTCQDVLDGYNGTIFAYGQTGSGKTFTMMGVDIYDEETMGIIPRSVNFIFESIANQEFDVECIIKCSMLEIYKETLRDLIDPGSNQYLKIKESPENGIYVQGLMETCVSTVQDVYEIIEIGNEQRIVAATGMNQNSSRSHSIFIMQVDQK